MAEQPQDGPRERTLAITESQFATLRKYGHGVVALLEVITTGAEIVVLLGAGEIAECRAYVEGTCTPPPGCKLLQRKVIHVQTPELN